MAKLYLLEGSARLGAGDGDSARCADAVPAIPTRSGRDRALERSIPSRPPLRSSDVATLRKGEDRASLLPASTRSSPDAWGWPRQWSGSIGPIWRRFAILQFGHGAAAGLVTAEPYGVSIRQSLATTLADSHDLDRRAITDGASSCTCRVRFQAASPPHWRTTP
jgi:hypothetical protein